MIDTQSVTKRMEEKGIQQKDVATAWECSQCTVSLKLNNKRPMFLDEAIKLKKLLEIEDADFGKYFFTQEVA